jgi:hypothetical protein
MWNDLCEAFVSAYSPRKTNTAPRSATEEIVDALRRVQDHISQTEALPAGTTAFKLKTAHLPTGVYSVRLTAVAESGRITTTLAPLLIHR